MPTNRNGTVSMSIDPEGMDELLRRLDPSRTQAAQKAMVTGIAGLLLRYSQIGAPVRTGNLRRAGFMQIDEDGQNGIVAFGAHYAGVVEGGSGPHEISAVNAGTLAFVPTSFSTLAGAEAAVSAKRATGSVAKGRVAQSLAIFPTHVFHPGTLPNPFLQSAWTDASPEAATLISSVGQRMMGGQEQVE